MIGGFWMSLGMQLDTGQDWLGGKDDQCRRGRTPDEPAYLQTPDESDTLKEKRVDCIITSELELFKDTYASLTPDSR